jgi:hypothetical protein
MIQNMATVPEYFEATTYFQILSTTTTHQITQTKSLILHAGRVHFFILTNNFVAINGNTASIIVII